MPGPNDSTRVRYFGNDAPSGNTSIDNLVWVQKWGDSPIGSPVELTYSFYGPGSALSYQTSFTPGAVADDLKAQIREALRLWSEVCYIKFTEVPESATGNGTLRYMMDPNMGTAAYAWYPSSNAQGGDVVLGGGVRAQAKGSWSFMALLHETGHALGLDHPHEGRPAPVPGEDAQMFSVMSYRDYPGDGLNSYQSNFLPTTPMLNDIAAVQYLYGANMSTRAGDTVYSWAPGERVYQTIWDGGGNDTLDGSNQDRAVVFNLNSGQWSSIGATMWDGRENTNSHLTIAYNCTIENCKGSAFDDTLLGNIANNVMEGNAGADTLDGRGGNDRLVGEVGNDTYIFARGYGQDVVQDVDSTAGNTDRIRLGAGITTADISVFRQGDDIGLQIKGTTDQVTISRFLASTANRVERVEFADGTVWDADRLVTLATGAPPPPPPPTPTNRAPVVTTTNGSVAANQATKLAPLIRVTDADGDAITRYEFKDLAGGGYFRVNGTRQADNQAFSVTAADLVNVEYVGGGAAGSEALQVRAFDGKDWSASASLTMTTTAASTGTNQRPVVTASNATVRAGQAVAAKTLFQVSDPNGDAITRYAFWDGGSGGGYFRVNGVVQAAGRVIYVSAADLDKVQYVGGSRAGTERVFAAASDGKLWSSWQGWTMSTLAAAGAGSLAAGIQGPRGTDRPAPIAGASGGEFSLAGCIPSLVNWRIDPMASGGSESPLLKLLRASEPMPASLAG
jgi:hypothetical protein